MVCDPDTATCRAAPDLGAPEDWKHGGVWGNVGLSYAFGCGALSHGAHAIFRIAGNGHWDTYDDYGF